MTESMRDPYEVLGVERQANAADIKAAWRKLAKQFHPDRAPGDARIAESFHEISTAYEFLRDERRRRRYDAGEIDAAGRRRRFGNWEVDETSGPGHEVWKAGFASGGGLRGEDSPGRTEEDLNFKFSSSEREEVFHSQGIFSELFGSLRGAPRMRRRGPDVTYRLDVSFEEAALGANRRVRLPSGKRLDVRIPAGTESGRHVRLQGEGGPGGRGAAGDAVIVMQVEPHEVFRREGSTVHSELAVSVPQALLGANVMAATIHGQVSLTVPPGSNTGTVLRVKGKGVAVEQDGGKALPPGDHFFTLRVLLPDPQDPEFTALVRRWAAGQDRELHGEASASGTPSPAPKGIRELKT